MICSPNPAGFFSDYFYVLGHIAIADKLGMLPFVDMQNYPSLYSEDDYVNGTLNSWEYYFNNCGAYNIDEV